MACEFEGLSIYYYFSGIIIINAAVPQTRTASTRTHSTQTHVVHVFPHWSKHSVGLCLSLFRALEHHSPIHVPLHTHTRFSNPTPGFYASENTAWSSASPGGQRQTGGTCVALLKVRTHERAAAQPSRTGQKPGIGNVIITIRLSTGRTVAASR